MKKVLFIIISLVSIYSVLYGQKYTDIDNSYLVCDNGKLEFEDLSGIGKILDNVGLDINVKERNSNWIIIPIAEGGSLSFDIKPQKKSDDFDFIVYKIEKKEDISESKRPIRVMLSGRNIKNGATNDEDCLGQTGLRKESNDYNENPGCAQGDDSYLKEIDAKSGEYYLVWINNFKPNGGYSIDWTGSAKLGLQSNKLTVIYDEETGELQVSDPIFDYSGNIEKENWNFGSDAIVTKNPESNTFSVFYKVSGLKTITHTVKLKSGCEFSYSENIFINKPLLSSYFSTVSLYPNPTKNSFHLIVDSNLSEVVDCKIINNIGEVVHKANLNFNQGRNDLEFKVKSYSAGEYKVLIQTSKGTIIERFVKIL